MYYYISFKQKQQRRISEDEGQNFSNTSPCKTSYSFGKGSRFEKLRSSTPNKFYEQTSQKNKRATSLGFGHKAKLLNKNSGDPGLYHIKSTFDVTKPHSSQQAIFGQSHNQIYDRMIKQRDTPGPGEYNPEETKNIKFYIGQKLKTSCNLLTPSPQSYQLKQQCISKLSKYTKERSFRIRTEGTQKLQRFKKKAPGPGQYNITDVNSIESVFRKSKMRPSFSRTQRIFPIQTQTTAGPGSYQAFSAFADNQQ